MIISLIAILTNNHVIGRRNTIPWYFTVDIAWFKYHTVNKPVIMGRKTFESMGEQPLKGRLNIILSHKLYNSTLYNDVIIVDDPVIALSLVEKFNEVMIIGGGSIYNFFLNRSTRMYLTYINDIFIDKGDTLFPKYNHAEWNSVCNFYKLCKNSENWYYNLNFKILNRNRY